MVKETLLGKTLEQLKEVASVNGMPAFTSKQMADWLYVNKVTDIQQMTNLSVAKRDTLSLKYEVGR
ncbi:MAG: 23S rRNA (adenine(2503)-C(2))-methyltransferase RlmN, partial [Bacteroidota bacterium]|nr:23S rRNA (adenine(2503)-C(2))-methyltransferase RlmN [Bacteroidota bacterium]